MNCLVLFSGTKSFSKILQNKEDIKEIRTVDLDNTFNPTYNVNILEWDYKKDLKDYKVDYLHSSPVCKEFSNMKNVNKKRDLNLGFSLVDKTIEIIEWIKENNNKDLKFTIENPKTKYTTEYPPLMKYKYVITSYCRYGFLYQKDTTFWYGGFDLKLKEKCSKKIKCFSKSINEGIDKRSNKGQIGDILYFKELRKLIKDNPEKNNEVHKVILGYKSKNPIQMIDWKYFTYLRKNEDYKNIVMSDTYFRYRIPPELIEDIYNCFKNVKEKEIIEEIIDN